MIPDRLRTALGDRYELRAELGRGGMASVFLAQDRKHDRPVAIKVLREELLTTGLEGQRFLREIRIAARLTHPQILPVYDSGERTGMLYYVMPYVAGETLRNRLDRETRLPVDEAVAIARNVALALDYAHRQGIVHRDIKPENLMLLEGQALVADFGIARAVHAAAESVTARGLAIGTPAYMSPEQATADDQVDGRSDLYSLGCVLYEMLTGRPPFNGQSVRAIIMSHLVDAPIPPSELRPTAPPAVERAVLRALAKEPNERFGTMQEFADALLAEVGPRPYTAEEHRSGRAIAVMPFVNATPDAENEYLSDGMTDELITALAKVPGLAVAPRSAVFGLKGNAVDARAVGRELGVSAVLEGSVRRSGERVRINAQLSDVDSQRLLWAERYDRNGSDVLGLQDEMARTIVDTLRGNWFGQVGNLIPTRYTDNAAAYHLYLKGRYAWNKRSPAGIREAISYFEQALREDPSYALAHSGLSDSHALQVDYRGAPVTEAMRRAREEAERALALDDELAEAHTSLAWVSFIHDWDWTKARHHYERAIELNPRYATARQWYGWYLLAMGRVSEAIAQQRDAAELDPTSVSIRRSLGWLLYVGGRLADSIVELERAQAMNPTSEETQWLLGRAYIAAGRYDEAEVVLEEARANSGEIFHAFVTLARLAALRGDRSRAAAALRHLDDVARSRYVSPVEFVRLNLVLGDHDEAFRWIERVWLERRGWMVYLKVDADLDPLRPDPRFAEWLRQMRLD